MSKNKHNGIVQPYLFFNGRCEEALEFYKNAIGAEVTMLMRYKESPEKPPEGMLAPGFENKVMHASVRVGQSIVMCSDGCSAEAANFNGFSLSLALSTPEEVDRIFNALAVGGKIEMPVTKTFWSPRFGMLTDKFGIGWMVTVMVDAHK